MSGFLVTAEFVAHDADEAQQIFESLSMLAENDSYSFGGVVVQPLKTEDRERLIDSGVLDESEFTDTP